MSDFELVFDDENQTPEMESNQGFSLEFDENQPDFMKVKRDAIENARDPIGTLTMVAKNVLGSVSSSSFSDSAEGVGNAVYNVVGGMVKNADTIGQYAKELPKTIMATGFKLGEKARNIKGVIDEKLETSELYEFQNDKVSDLVPELAKGFGSEVAVTTPKMMSDMAHWVGTNMKDPSGKKSNALSDAFLGLSDVMKNISDYMGEVDLLKSNATALPDGSLSYGQIGNVLGHGVGQGASMAVMAGTLGPKAAYGFYALAGGADVFKQSYEKEGDIGKANTLATINAASTYMIDRWFDPLPENIATGARMTAKQVVKEVGKSAIKEPLAEGAQQIFAENLVRKIGLDAEQDLFEGVAESMIGAFGGAAAMGGVSAASAYSAERHYQEAKEKAVELGATEGEVEQYRRATLAKLQQHPEAFDTVFQQNVQKTIQEIDTFIKENGSPEEVRKAMQTKADLEEVYNRVYEQIKTKDNDKVASAQAKVVQGVALWGAQELGISPLEYFEQRFPRIERTAYRDFAQKINKAKRASEKIEINLYEALKNPKLLRGHRKKDNRLSLTQFLRNKGGLIDTGGDLKAMDADKSVRGLINNKKGNNLDDATLSAWEAGYFPQFAERPTINDLLDAIDKELRGNKIYASEKEDSLQDQVDALEEELDRIEIDWRNMEPKEIEMAVDAYLERQRAYRKSMEEEDTGENGLAWFQGKITDSGALSIDTKEEMQGLSDEEFKVKMLETLKGLKGKKIYNTSLAGEIEIRTSSIKKYKSFFADKNKRLIVPYIPELLEKARFIKEDSYTQKTEPNIKAYWKSDLPIRIDNDNFDVRLTVREDNQGNFFWDAQVQEKAPNAPHRLQIRGIRELQETPRTDPATNPGDKGLTSEISEDTLSITPSEGNVNRTFYQGGEDKVYSVFDLKVGDSLAAFGVVEEINQTDRQIKIGGQWHSMFMLDMEANRFGLTLGPKEEIDISEDVEEEVKKVSEDRSAVEGQKSNNAEYNKIAEDYFGVTNNLNLGGYILTDGNLLDLSGKKLGSDGRTRSIDHREVSDAFEDNNVSMEDFINSGNIRYMPESNSILMSDVPNSKQYKIIEEIINRANGQVNIELMSDANNWGSFRDYSREYPDGTTLATIKRDINAFYKGEGVRSITTYFQFAGEKAQTAALNELNRAKQLEKEGLDNEAIRQQTGWFKGPDNKWRFEISDADADFASGYNPDEWKKNGVVFNGLTFKLGKILKHDKLFAAYPQLKDVVVEYTRRLSDGALGNFTPSENKIYIDSTMSADKIKDVLLHEVQHAIQETEGFARGGSEESAVDALRAKIMRTENSSDMGEFLSWVDEYEMLNDVSTIIRLSEKPESLTKTYWFYERFMGTPKNKKDRQQFLNEKGQEFLDFMREKYQGWGAKTYRYQEYLQKDKAEIEKMRKSASQKVDRLRKKVYSKGYLKAKDLITKFQDHEISAYTLYKQLYGEIEARNTQARANMTDEQRRATPIEETQDIKTSDAIIVFGNGVAMAYEPSKQDGADLIHRDPKGAFSKRINQRALISMFERADASTFMHETAHFFFEELKAFAKTSKKSAEMLDTINKWLGYDGVAYTEAQIEQFARGFEQYLREGKAPSNYLKRVFDAFMSWMRNLYKTARELDVQLNDDVRAVYANILGGTELDKYMDATPAEVLGNSKKYWKAKREAMDDIYAQNNQAKKAERRLFGKVGQSVQKVYDGMRDYLSDAPIN